MKIIFYQSIMIFFMIMLMIIFLNSISKKTFKDREKMSPFECGFDPKNSARLPFSLQFFLIAVIFVIFDIELTLILPITLIFKKCNIMSLSVTASIFILILLFGLFHEQNQGSLNWMN
uniref:NADH-ubiquinone oxidoreductase chain 3 n=1 Tax=Eucryptorrhynchus scrobiculatus TaxID=1552824 RepID=A0A410PAH4_EUCSC|nr:NADH dehydrogenase subunit 3 [Eucryptorrhynchus scrobiculatus]UFP90424.1 NADH dehydrogenase subunit 3 [Eucryptorrhynchus scrobiculatus]